MDIDSNQMPNAKKKSHHHYVTKGKIQRPSAPWWRLPGAALHCSALQCGSHFVSTAALISVVQPTVWAGSHWSRPSFTVAKNVVLVLILYFKFRQLFHLQEWICRNLQFFNFFSFLLWYCRIEPFLGFFSFCCWIEIRSKAKSRRHIFIFFVSSLRRYYIRRHGRGAFRETWAVWPETMSTRRP